MSSRPQEIVTLLQAQRFSVQRVTHRLADNRPVVREVVRHPGAVVVVPVLDDGRICLIKNYRAAVNLELIELPAGTREPNEPPIETARRELLEETGYRCASIEPLCDFFMSPGILDEHMYAFVAEGLTAENPAREFGEEIETLLVSREQLDAMLVANQIQDAKSIATLLYFERFRR
ncbi:MAG: NUDIX hydrolase [Pirellulaceae bacterium]